MEDRGKKVAYTHFVSVPISTPELQQKYSELKALVSAERIPNISKYAWQKQPEHHLTILMLDLSDPQKFDLAKSVLQDL